MREVTFSGKNRNPKPNGKHHKPPRVFRPWQMATGVAGASVLCALLFSFVIISATKPDPILPNDNAYQVRVTTEYDTAEERQAAEEEAAIAEQDRLWIERIRELSREQQEDIAARQALLEEEARATAEANAAAAAARQAPALTGAIPLLIGDQSTAAAIDIYLIEKGSPMAGYGRAFVSAGKTFNVDPFLVVAICGKESSWGKNCFLPFNAWGWGDVAFTGWENAIFNYTRYFSEEYTSKGRTAIAAIAPVYCPPNWVEWTNDVSRFYSEVSSVHSGLTP